MKYAYFIVIVISLLTSTSWSFTTNPQIRSCRLAGGEFVEVKTAQDQIGLCKFGSAYIGALDILQYTDTKEYSLAALYFGIDLRLCDGAVIDAENLEKTQSFKLCTYNGESYIEMNTLNKGVHHPDNKQLKDFLNYKY